MWLYPSLQPVDNVGYEHLTQLTDLFARFVFVVGAVDGDEVRVLINHFLNFIICVRERLGDMDVFHFLDLRLNEFYASGGAEQFEHLTAKSIDFFDRKIPFFFDFGDEEINAVVDVSHKFICATPKIKEFRIGFHFRPPELLPSGVLGACIMGGRAGWY